MLTKQQEELRQSALDWTAKAEFIINITISDHGSGVVIMGERERLLEALLIREFEKDQSLLLSIIDIRKKLGEVIETHLRISQNPEMMERVHKLLNHD